MKSSKSSKKILIITSSYDLTVDYFIEKFKEKTVFYRFNTDFFKDYIIEIDEIVGWVIKYKHWEINQSQIDAIYYRKPSMPNISEYNPKFHRMIQKDLLTLFQGLVETFKGRCLTKPSILNLAENKIYQLAIAKDVGFNFPKTLISNSSNKAIAFSSTYHSIIKPLSSGRVYSESKVGIIQTNIVNEDFRIEGLELSPSYFQEYIKKDYEVRVTIICNSVFAVRIEASNQVDWRKSDSINHYSNIVLPQDITDKCYKMMDKLNLRFGAFDFIVNNGNYYFLEVNPNGQWLWLEEALNLKISDCIYDYLTGLEL
jgi:glutathione synthase/RimK-type ligase-like ATP-grasp enzyme